MTIRSCFTRTTPRPHLLGHGDIIDADDDGAPRARARSPRNACCAVRAPHRRAAPSRPQATTFGVCTSLGLGAMQLNAGLNYMSTTWGTGVQIADNADSHVIIVLGITLIATTCSDHGAARGKHLSTWRLRVASSPVSPSLSPTTRGTSPTSSPRRSATTPSTSSAPPSTARPSSSSATSSARPTCSGARRRQGRRGGRASARLAPGRAAARWRRPTARAAQPVHRGHPPPRAGERHRRRLPPRRRRPLRRRRRPRRGAPPPRSPPLGGMLPPIRCAAVRRGEHDARRRRRAAADVDDGGDRAGGRRRRGGVPGVPGDDDGDGGDVGDVRRALARVLGVPVALRLDEHGVDGLVDRLLLGVVDLVGAVRRHVHGDHLARPHGARAHPRRVLRPSSSSRRCGSRSSAASRSRWNGSPSSRSASSPTGSTARSSASATTTGTATPSLDAAVALADGGYYMLACRPFITQIYDV